LRPYRIQPNISKTVLDRLRGIAGFEGRSLSMVTGTLIVMGLGVYERLANTYVPEAGEETFVMPEPELVTDEILKEEMERWAREVRERSLQSLYE
jgi:hypothetical protein